MTLVAADFNSRNLPQARNLLGLIQTLRKFDPAVLAKLFAGLQAFTNAKTLAEQVQAAIELLKVGVTLTPSKADDKIVEILDSIVSPELLDVIVRLVGSLVSNAAMAQDVSITAKHREIAAAKAIPWGFLVQLATMIAQLIEQLSKKTASAAVVPPVAK